MMRDRDSILTAIRRTVEANGNKPPGERSFYIQTKLSRVDLQRAGFPNYGAALEAAGYTRNKLQQAFTDDQLFLPLAELTRRLGHFPTTNERQVERYRDHSFPSYEAYSRRAEQELLDQALLTWCRARESFEDVVRLLESRSRTPRHPPSGGRHKGQVINGYVYLMRYGAHGKDYKIGWTENVSRRQSQLDMVSPSDVRQVHVIATDDPKGIEKYWHDRFADKRIKTKELFRLSPEDIAAFKCRNYQ